MKIASDWRYVGYERPADLKSNVFTLQRVLHPLQASTNDQDRVLALRRGAEDQPTVNVASLERRKDDRNRPIYALNQHTPIPFADEKAQIVALATSPHCSQRSGIYALDASKPQIWYIKNGKVVDRIQFTLPDPLKLTPTCRLLITCRQDADGVLLNDTVAVILLPESHAVVEVHIPDRQVHVPLDSGFRLETGEVAPSRQTPLPRPVSASYDTLSGHLFVADTGNRAVYAIDSQGKAHAIITEQSLRDALQERSEPALEFVPVSVCFYRLAELMSDPASLKRRGERRQTPYGDQPSVLLVTDSDGRLTWLRLDAEDAKPSLALQAPGAWRLLLGTKGRLVLASLRPSEDGIVIPGLLPDVKRQPVGRATDS